MRGVPGDGEERGTLEKSGEEAAEEQGIEIDESKYRTNNKQQQAGSRGMEILGKRVGSHTECGEDTSYKKGASVVGIWLIGADRMKLW